MDLSEFLFALKFRKFDFLRKNHILELLNTRNLYNIGCLLKKKENMPKLYEYLGIIILFYSNEHEPIHVHGKYQEFESKAEFIIIEGKIVEINIKEVKGKRPLSTKKHKDFEKFVHKYKNEIINKLVDYFVYHKSVTCVKVEERV